MATKKLVPRATNEGGLGTSLKVWGPSWLQNLVITNLQTSTSVFGLVEDNGNVEKRNLTTIGIDVQDTNDSTSYVGLWESATGTLLPKTDAELRYDATNDTLKIGKPGSDLWISSGYITQYFKHLKVKVKGGISITSSYGKVHIIGGITPLTSFYSIYGTWIHLLQTEMAPANIITEAVPGGASTNIPTGMKGVLCRTPLSSLGIPPAVADTENPACFIGMYEAASGVLGAKTDESLTYDALNEVLKLVGNMEIGSTANSTSHGIRRVPTTANSGGSFYLLSGNANGGTDKLGGDLLIQAGQGTGAAAGSKIKFYAPQPLTSGSAPQSYGLQSGYEPAMVIDAVNSINRLRINTGSATQPGYLETSVYGKGIAVQTTHDISGTNAAHHHIQAQGYVSLNSTLGQVDFRDNSGGGNALLGRLSGTGLFVDNIPAEPAPTHIMVDNTTTPGLFSKMAISALPTQLITVQDTDDTTCFVGLWESAAGNLAPKTDEVFKFNAHDGSQALLVPRIYANTNTTSAASNLFLHAEPAINGGPTNAAGGHVTLHGASGTGTGASGGVQIYGTRPSTISGSGGHTTGNIALFDNRHPNYSEMTIWDPISVATTDYFRVSVTANGATTLSTVDVAGAAAHLALDSDGDTSFKKTGTTLATVESLRTESFMMACSDETTALTTGNGKVTFRMPYAFTVTDVRASLSTAGTGAQLVTVDINESGTSILSTKITIDATETTSVTAAAAPVISDASLADDAEITVDIDFIDTGGVSKGLKVAIIGHKTV